MSETAFFLLEQQIKECSVDEKLTLLSFIANLLKKESVPEKKTKRTLGALKGKIWMSEDFDETPECFKEYI